MILLVIIGAAPEAYSASYSQNIQYGSTIYYTSYGGYGLPIPINEKEVSVLEETGSDIIRIDMDETAWIIYLSNDIKNMDYAIPAIEAYDRVIEKIRKDNKKVFIADTGAELYRRNPVPWKTFKANQLAVFSFIASRYKPDYFEVVKEPDYYSGGRS